MTTPLASLLGFVTWTLLLLLTIGAIRIGRVLSGSATVGSFPGGERHGGERYWRLNRAHANCVENLPLFAAVVLVGAILDLGHPILDRLAVVYLAARVCQSLTHIASGSDRIVSLRFGFFGVQIVCLAWMLLLTVRLSGL